MSIGNEIAWRRGQRGKDASGSLVFDAERRQAQREASDEKRAEPAKASLR